MADNTTDADKMAFATSFVPMDEQTANHLLPFVRAAIQAMGDGCVFVSLEKEQSGEETLDRRGGLFLSAPAPSLQSITQLVSRLKEAPLPFFEEGLEIEALSTFPPSLDFAEIVHRLDLCPPDLQCVWFSNAPFCGVLVFAGLPYSMVKWRGTNLPKVTGLLATARSAHDVWYEPVIVTTLCETAVKELFEQLAMLPSYVKYFLLPYRCAGRTQIVLTGPSEYKADFEKVREELTKLLAAVEP